MSAVTVAAVRRSLRDNPYPFPHDLDERAARHGLGLAPGDCVLLCFGQLWAYTGVPELLAAFAEVTQLGVRLVVAGRPVDQSSADAVSAVAASDTRIVAHLAHVDDADVQLYFEAADWVVLPCREASTSGIVMRALSFGRPIVAPRQGGFAELGSADGVLVYEPDRPHALATALAYAAATDARPWRARALATARRSDWDTIHRAHDRSHA